MSRTLAEALASIGGSVSQLDEIKENIRLAIEDKGVAVPENAPFDTYPDLILAIKVGGGSTSGGDNGNNNGSEPIVDINNYKAMLNYNATAIFITFDKDPGNISVSNISVTGDYGGTWSLSGTDKTRVLTSSKSAGEYGLSSGSATNTLTLKINYSTVNTKTVTWTIIRNGNSAEYTANATWILPSNTGAIKIQAIAKGGNGGSGAYASYESIYSRASGGGGSSGAYKDTGWQAVDPASTPNLVMTGVASGTLIISGAYSVTLSQGANGGSASASISNDLNGTPRSATQTAGTAGSLSGTVSGKAGSTSTTSSGTVAGGTGGSWSTLPSNGKGGDGASVTTSVGTAGTGTGGKVRIYFTTWTLTGGDA